MGPRNDWPFIWEFIADADPNVTSIWTPWGTLPPETELEIMVRDQDEDGVWSDWGLEAYTSPVGEWGDPPVAMFGFAPPRPGEDTNVRFKDESTIAFGCQDNGHW
jgi:hypothetical protein